MHLKYFSLFILLLSSISSALADVKGDNYREVNQNIEEASDLDEIHEALTEYSKLNEENSLLYEQKRREMLDSVETRFYACDTDSDDTLDVFETTQCLPQVARQFREVDINNDNVISLDEISLLAKDHSKPQYAKSNDKKKTKSEAALQDTSPVKSIKNKTAL